MTKTSEEPVSAFTLEHAMRLAETSSTKKVRSPYSNQPAALLVALRSAAFRYNKTLDDEVFERTFLDEGRQLKELEADFHRFKYRWDRTDLPALADIGYFADVDNNSLGEVAERNQMISEALEILKTGLKAAIEQRCADESGRPEKRPGLKEFVKELYRDWTVRAPGIPFGDLFEGGIDGDDRVPVSSASKLVVEAMKILDPEVSGRDCETAIRAVKNG